ncbi:MAG TPA: DUF4389 domain-containing protein [Dermatophilaceae bacterium]
MGILVGGGSAGSSQQSDWAFRSSGGLLSILALVAVVIFAFSGNYPRGLFDLLMGLNRWVYRVYAYMMLMTDEYPPVPAGQRRRGSDDSAGFAGGATRLTLILRPQIEGHGDLVGMSRPLRACAVPG